MGKLIIKDHGVVAGKWQRKFHLYIDDYCIGSCHWRKSGGLTASLKYCASHINFRNKSCQSLNEVVDTIYGYVSKTWVNLGALKKAGKNLTVEEVEFETCS